MTQKVNITSAQLKKWLVENGVKLSGLEQEMGVAQPYLSSFFNKTTKGRRGGVRYFTPVIAENLNAAMHQVAERLRGMLINLNPEEPGVMGRKLMYYPVVLERMQPLRTYLMLKAFMRKALGWTYNITSAKVINPSNQNYGHITQDDATGIDTALLQLAEALDRFQLVPDAPPSGANEKITINNGQQATDNVNVNVNDNSQTSDIKHQTSKKSLNDQTTKRPNDQQTGNHERRRVASGTREQSGNVQFGGEDPVLSQWRAVKEEYPKSVVIFRHSGVYVTVDDDAELVSRITPLKAEYSSGTALCLFANPDLDIVLPRLVKEDIRIVFQDLKEER